MDEQVDIGHASAPEQVIVGLFIAFPILYEEIETFMPLLGIIQLS